MPDTFAERLEAASPKKPSLYRHGRWSVGQHRETGNHKTTKPQEVPVHPRPRAADHPLPSSAAPAAMPEYWCLSMQAPVARLFTHHIDGCASTGSDGPCQRPSPNVRGRLRIAKRSAKGGEATRESGIRALVLCPSCGSRGSRRSHATAADFADLMPQPQISAQGRRRWWKLHRRC